MCQGLLRKRFDGDVASFIFEIHVGYKTKMPWAFRSKVWLCYGPNFGIGSNIWPLNINEYIAHDLDGTLQLTLLMKKNQFDMQPK